jgi:hypothetical protein
MLLRYQKQGVPEKVLQLAISLFISCLLAFKNLSQARSAELIVEENTPSRNSQKEARLGPESPRWNRNPCLIIYILTLRRVAVVGAQAL